MPISKELPEGNVLTRARKRLALKRSPTLPTSYCILALTIFAQPALELKLNTSQADAVLSLLEQKAAEGSIAHDDWQRLFLSEGHTRLKRREESLKRDFPEAAFRDFVNSPDLARQAAALRKTLESWKKADIARSAKRVMQYLPSEARINATVYPVIKPQSNSFVFETTTNPAIFMYLDPSMSETAFENTVAHELHHVGLASVFADYEERISKLPDNVRKAATWAGALGEGLAVLAAAGSIDRHPMLDFPPEDRIRWDQDMAGVNQLLRQVNDFLLDVAKGGFAKPEVADRVAFTFFGYRGPWYTVGYHVAVVVEQRFGRGELIDCMRDYRRLLARYNEAAAALNATTRPSKLALWSEELTAILSKP